MTHLLNPGTNEILKPNVPNEPNVFIFCEDFKKIITLPIYIKVYELSSFPLFEYQSQLINKSGLSLISPEVEDQCTLKLFYASSFMIP